MTKSKSKIIICICLLSVCLFIASPSQCMKSTLNGLNIWLANVVPALFPFFILTKIIISFNQSSIPPLDKFTRKFFHTDAGLVYALSILSGYPVGAKMISSYYSAQKIDKTTATNMLSFCSTSGPMFIIGSVGIGIFHSAKIGYILLISHIMGSFLNGIIFTRKQSTLANNPSKNLIPNTTPASLNDIMYDSIVSILMVGGYIVFASVIISMLQSTILPYISVAIAKLIPTSPALISGFLCGILEMTNGILALSLTSVSLKIKVILSSFLIAFSGVCIILQSVGFLNKMEIKKSLIIKQKLMQGILTVIVTTLIVLIIKI